MTQNDIDILAIDNKIRDKFQEDIEKLPEYTKRLFDLELTAKNTHISLRARNDLEKNITKLKETIEKITNGNELNFYISETTEFLEVYKKLLQTPLKVSFVGKAKNDNKERNNIITKYLEVAQKYYNTNIELPEKKVKLTCDNCPNKKDFIFEENTYICTECGAQQEVIQYSSSYKDADRVNISTKYTYDRKVHFRDCINQYQGKQNCTIPQKVYDDLENIFERHHLLVGDKNTKKEIRFSKITKEHVLMFLKELKYSKHYENVTLIHYNITGKKPDDISHIEEILMNDFDILVETYDKYCKNKVERVNFISTQYVLYQLLQRHKHPCKKEDFAILKTTDRKSFHDDICKELFEILGWNHVPLF